MDTRDNGLSVPTVEPGPPDWEAIFTTQPGAPVPLAYTAGDMADDIIAVLDELEIPSAALAGASMGAALVRWAAVRHPIRVRALMLVMGLSGAISGEDGPPISDEVLGRLAFLFTPQDRSNAVNDLVDTWRWLWGPHYPFDESWVRARVEASFDRSYRPIGVARNMAAMSLPGLWQAQTAISCPTLVMHGDDDPAAPPEHGRAIAERISQTELWAVPQMGHTMHSELWPEMTRRLMRLNGAERSRP